MSCPIIFNSNTIELTMHTSCYYGLRLTLCYCFRKNLSVEDLERFVATFKKHAGSKQTLSKEDFGKMLSTKNVRKFTSSN